MKLIDILKYIDKYIQVIIWDTEDDENPIFEGNILEIPWYISEMRLTEPEENNYSNAIFPIKDGVLRITVIEEEKK